MDNFFGGCCAAEGSRRCCVIRKNVQLTRRYIAEQAIHAGTDPALGGDSRAVFPGTRRRNLQRADHQYNVVAEGLDGVVPPGASTCGIEDTDVAIEPQAMAAVGKIQFFW